MTHSVGSRAPAVPRGALPLDAVLQRSVLHRSAIKQALAAGPILARKTYVDLYKQPLVKGNTYRLQVIKRPDNQTDATDAIIDDLWPQYPNVSETERALYLAAGGAGQQATAKQMVNAQQWLSKNNAAVCHKLAIDRFMAHLVEWVADLFEDVALGQPPVGDAEMDKLIAKMTVNTAIYGPNARNTWAQLKAYRTPPPLTKKGWPYAKSIAPTVDGLCDVLVRDINRSPANLYIGNALANSTIRSFFDAHIPVDPAVLTEVTATPRSGDIYDAEHQLAAAFAQVPSSPIRQVDAATGDPMYATSSVIPAPGMGMGWNFPPSMGGGGHMKL